MPYCLLLVVLLLSACGELTNPLPPELAFVGCAPDAQIDNNHTLLNYGDHSIYAICLNEELLRNKRYLKCDNAYANPGAHRQCDTEDFGFAQFFSNLPNGTVVQGSVLTSLVLRDMGVISSLSVMASNAPKEKFSPVAVKKDDYFKSFILKDLYTPKRYELIHHVVCSQRINGLHVATCSADVMVGDMTLSLTLRIFGKENQIVPKEVFHQQFDFWFGFLDELVVPTT